MTLIIADAPPLHGIRQRVQQLAARFARILSDRGGKLWYFDEPGNIVTVFISPEKPLRNLWSWMGGPVRDQDAGITHFVPPAGLPFGYHSQPVNQWNHFWYRAGLGSRFYKPDGPIVLIVCNVLGLGWLGKFREDIAIYDIADEISEFRQAGMHREAVLAQEDRLISRVDAVVATAQSLYEKKSVNAKFGRLIRNAADIGHFRQAIDLAEHGKRPADIADLEKPIVGYIGYLADWLDWPLIESVVKNGTEFDWVFIGPTTRNLSDLLALPNFHWLGKKPYNDLPAYLAHFACAHIPFDMTPLTVHVNPVKIYEYLAGGVPVVATPLPELEHFRDVCEIAANPGEYLDAVRWSIENDSSIKRSERLKHVENETWDSRVGDYCELINNLLT